MANLASSLGIVSQLVLVSVIFINALPSTAFSIDIPPAIDDLDLASWAPLSDSERKHASSLLRAAWENSEQLRSGRFDAVVNHHGSAVGPDGRSAPRSLVAAKVSCVFDLTKDSWLYDVQLLDGNKNRYVVTPNGSLNYEPAKKWLTRSGDTAFGKDGRSGSWLLEPRTLGWTAPADQVSVGDPFHQLRDVSLTADKIVHLVTQEAGKTEIFWRPHEIVVASITLDSQGSLNPVRCTQWFAFPFGQKGSTRYKCVKVTDSKWERRGDFNIPTHVVAMDSVGDSRQTSVDVIWKEINEPIAEREFTIDGANIPTKTVVLEVMENKSVIVGAIDDDGKVLITNPLFKKPTATNRGWTLLWVGLLNIAIIICIIVFWIRFRSQA
ncbi:MAG: hypothetical protein JWP89_1264 [Schlesneria sp.]|nr:hypothetical protein [Schlesneria sp.]